MRCLERTPLEQRPHFVVKYHTLVLTAWALDNDDPLRVRTLRKFM